MDEIVPLHRSKKEQIGWEIVKNVLYAVDSY